MSKSKRKPRKRKFVEVGQPERQLSMCDMPTEILFNIMEHLTIWDRIRVRRTCHKLRDICDSSLMHLYKKSLRKFAGQAELTYESAALKTIDQTCWAYIEAGYTHTFLGTLLSKVRETSGFYPFSPKIEKMRKFLKRFHQILNEKDCTSLNSRLMFTVTLLGFLKSLPNASLTFTKTFSSQYRRVVFELKGSWIGLLWSSRTPQARNNFNERTVLLILLNEIMVNALSGKPFRRVWDSDNQIFVYGHDVSDKRRTYPKTFFTLDLHGSKKVLNFFETASTTKTFAKLPTDEFHLSLKLFCPKTVSWGCYRSYLLDVGPPDFDVEEQLLFGEDAEYEFNPENYYDATFEGDDDDADSDENVDDKEHDEKDNVDGDVDKDDDEDDDDYDELDKDYLYKFLSNRI